MGLTVVAWCFARLPAPGERVGPLLAFVAAAALPSPSASFRRAPSSNCNGRQATKEGWSRAGERLARSRSHQALSVSMGRTGVAWGYGRVLSAGGRVG